MDFLIDSKILSIEKLTNSQYQTCGIILAWPSHFIVPGQLVNLGLDICGIERWQKILEREPGAVKVAFSLVERQWAAGCPYRLSLLWTVKEAFVKALGCGFGKVTCQDIVTDFNQSRIHIWLDAGHTIRTSGGLVKISDLAWQLVLFRNFSLVGSLILACKGKQYEELLSNMTIMGSLERALDKRIGMKIALELVAVSPPQLGMRRELRVRERLAAEKAAYNAASYLLPIRMYQHLYFLRTSGRQPLLQIDGMHETCLSLSHCSGWAAAALGGFFQ